MPHDGRRVCRLRLSIGFVRRLRGVSGAGSCHRPDGPRDAVICLLVAVRIDRWRQRRMLDLCLSHESCNPPVADGPRKHLKMPPSHPTILPSLPCHGAHSTPHVAWIALSNDLQGLVYPIQDPMSRELTRILARRHRFCPHRLGRSQRAEIIGQSLHYSSNIPETFCAVRGSGFSGSQTHQRLVNRSQLAPRRPAPRLSRSLRTGCRSSRTHCG
jgi:hypothetical protein